jgi:hypothetical protein
MYVVAVIGICVICFGLGILQHQTIQAQSQPNYVPPPPPLGTLFCKDGVTPVWVHVMGNFVGKETRKGLDVWMCKEVYEEMNKE